MRRSTQWKEHVCNENRFKQYWDPWHFGTDPDPLWLMESDPALDPTPFYSDFKNAKIYFFLTNYPQAHYNFILHALFQTAQHLYEKREGSRAGSGFGPLTNGFGSGRPQNMRIWIPNTGFKGCILTWLTRAKTPSSSSVILRAASSICSGSWGTQLDTTHTFKAQDY